MTKLGWTSKQPELKIFIYRVTDFIFLLVTISSLTILLGCDKEYLDVGLHQIKFGEPKGQLILAKHEKHLQGEELRNPWRLAEVGRYQCYSLDSSLAIAVFESDMKGTGFRWRHFNPNFDFINQDSLKKMSLEQKLTLIKSNNLKSVDGPSHPFPLELDVWYSLRAFDSEDARIFFYVSDSGVKQKVWRGGAF